MKHNEFKEGDRAIIVSINGTLEFKNYLLTNGISLGSILTKNYSPSYTRLVNLTTGGKMISLRSSDFESIDLVKI